MPPTRGSNGRHGGWSRVHGDRVWKANGQPCAGEGGWLLGRHHHGRGFEGGESLHKKRRGLQGLCARTDGFSCKHDQPSLCRRSGGEKGLLCWHGRREPVVLCSSFRPPFSSGHRVLGKRLW